MSNALFFLDSCPLSSYLSNVSQCITFFPLQSNRAKLVLVDDDELFVRKHSVERASKTLFVCAL